MKLSHGRGEGYPVSPIQVHQLSPPRSIFEADSIRAVRVCRKDDSVVGLWRALLNVKFFSELHLEYNYRGGRRVVCKN